MSVWLHFPAITKVLEKSHCVSRSDNDNIVILQSAKCLSHSQLRISIFSIQCPLWGPCPYTCVHLYMFLCTLDCEEHLNLWHILCTSYIWSDFYVMLIDMLSECFFHCVTHSKCHFIYGYLIAQSFICSWLHLFVSWLKWMHLQAYIKNHINRWTEIWRKATECILPGSLELCFDTFFLLKWKHFIFMQGYRMDTVDNPS